jgi:hypothetical protein
LWSFLSTGNSEAREAMRGSDAHALIAPFRPPGASIMRALTMIAAIKLNNQS